MIKGVVFDLDGVLVDSEPVWEQVRRGLVAERGGLAVRYLLGRHHHREARAQAGGLQHGLD